MDEEKLSRFIAAFWKNLILHRLGTYLLIDGLISFAFFALFGGNGFLLFVMFLTGIPRYIAGAMAGAKSLSIALNEVSKE